MRSIVLVLVSLSVAATAASAPDLRLQELASGTFLTGGKALEQLAAARIVLVGEHHTAPDHHAAQLKVIRALHENGRKIAVGLEMFLDERRATLDQFVRGELSEEELKRIYFEDWNFPWELYRPIFEYARQNQIPLIGLNVSRDITRQVARQGFDSLSPEQKEILGDITCEVTPAYRDFVARAHGAHDHGALAFESFCEAQLVWDTAMAVHALRYLDLHPDSTLVILAGSGHARRPGIPTQVGRRSAVPVAVILPYTPHVFERATLSAAEADFIIMP